MKRLLAGIGAPVLAGVRAVVLIATMLCAAGPAAAATCYLSDGSSLEYRKLWKQGRHIYVLINRDTLLTLSPDEVDQRRTLKAAGLKKFPLAVRVRKKAAPPPHAPAGAEQRTDMDNGDEKPLQFNDSRFATSEPAVAGRAKGARGAVSPVGDEPLTQQLLSVYESLHNAMKSKNFEGMKRYLSVRNASALGPREQAMIQAGISLRPPNHIPTGSSVSSDGTSATLTMEARSRRNDPKASALGTVSFVHEGGSWKVDQESWEINMD